MAVVAGAAQVLIVPDTTMFVIHVGLIVRVACYAFEVRKRAWHGMAFRAVAPAAPVRARINREILRVVVPGRGDPSGRRMTVDTCGWEKRCGVAGRDGGIVVSLMAGIAISRCSGVGGLVARVAIESQMTAVQGEAGQVVVKCGRLPGGCRMTIRARCRESTQYMIWIYSRRVIVTMAVVAPSRRARKSVRMAGSASDRRVSSRQGKRRWVLIGRLLPTPKGSVMAKTAVVIEGECRVVRIDRPRQIGKMARLTFRGRAHELPAITGAVAGIAIRNGMNAREREAAIGVLVKEVGLWLPVTRYMAVLAVAAQLAEMMIGVAIRARDPNMAEY